MVFSSHIFIFYFLPLAIVLYYATRNSLRLLVFTLLCYLFYAWANPWFVLVLIWSTVVDFCCGNLIYGHWRLPGHRSDGENPPPTWQRRLFLILSLCNSLGVLFTFKYIAFATENVNSLRAAVGMQPFRVLHFLLPIGISFYTFESISYVIDIYQDRAKPASVRTRQAAIDAGADVKPGRTTVAIEFRGLLNFACYIGQFPHLVAGPIIRFQDLESQMFQRRHTLEKFSRGIVFVCIGFAKKILIADTMGEIADYAFGGHPAVWSDAWFGLFAYAFQIYFDFSGYSDMAIGLGLMFGFEFAKNFDAPYKSASITEFWRRWHISLSSWLRDYLYFTLGGNRRGKLRTYLNLMVVMLLGGLWHGAQWTFIFWGGIHGAWLALERVFGKQPLYARSPRFVRVGLTFFIVCIAWVFFRSADLHGAISYLAVMFQFNSMPTPLIKIAHLGMWTPAHVWAMLAAASIAFFGVETWDLAKRVNPASAAFALIVFWSSIAALSVRSYTPFLYFRF
jgi:alginate O-acetyltransferase complex protein AlgI